MGVFWVKFIVLFLYYCTLYIQIIEPKPDLIYIFLFESLIAFIHYWFLDSSSGFRVGILKTFEELLSRFNFFDSFFRIQLFPHYKTYSSSDLRKFSILLSRINRLYMISTFIKVFFNFWSNSWWILWLND